MTLLLEGMSFHSSCCLVYTCQLTIHECKILRLADNNATVLFTGYFCIDSHSVSFFRFLHLFDIEHCARFASFSCIFRLRPRHYALCNKANDAYLFSNAYSPHRNIRAASERGVPNEQFCRCLLLNIWCLWFPEIGHQQRKTTET